MNKMRQQTLLITLAIGLLLPVVGEAQTSQTTHFSQSFPLGDHNVVKEYQYPLTIASAICGETNTSQFFYNVAGQTVASTLVRATEVYDFAIDNDTVFYCGRYSDGSGVIGFFNIQDLFFNGGQIFFSNQFSLRDYYFAEELYKLVTYRDTTGKRHVVCVGKAKKVRGNERPCIVDMISEPLMGFMSYNAGVVNDSTLTNSMLDITRFCTTSYPRSEDTTRDYLPCDYLIVAGVDTTKRLNIRFFDAQDPFVSSGPQNYRYSFYYDGSLIINDLNYTSSVLIYPMTDHSIGVASARLNYPFYFGSSNNLIISEINIFQLLSNSSTAMTRRVGVNITDCTRITSLDHFMYNSATSRFAVLLNGKSSSSGGARSYFLEANHSLTSKLNLLTGDDGDTECGDRGFSGFDTYQSQTRYVLFGNCRNSGSYQYNVELETSGTASGCMPQLAVEFSEITPPEAHRIASEVKVLGGRLNMQTMPGYLDNHEVNNDCSH